VVDHASVRCPALDPKLKAEWAKKTPRPAGWAAGTEAAKAGEMMDLIDKHELAEARKNGKGAELVRQYERCRNMNGDSEPTT
jgi:hypothetical protein